jgi:hypothetical protein
VHDHADDVAREVGGTLVDAGGTVVGGVADAGGAVLDAVFG